MINYIIPLITVITDLACFAFCIKFLISKEWRYWVAPMFESIALCLASVLCLLSVTLENVSEQVSTMAFSFAVILAVISFFLLISILLFAYRLKSRE